jgi:AbiV family abortive infection protein
MSQNEAATATLANAIRLYIDAKLLFANERYASCASLAVLAVEELAKFMNLIGINALAQSKIRSHTAKHLSTASFVLRKNYQSALRGALAGDAVDPKRLARLLQLDFRDDEMEMFDTILAKVVESGSLRTFGLAHQNEMDVLKQRGFYVDTDGQGKIRSTPESVTADEAKAQLDFVTASLKALRSHF